MRRADVMAYIKERYGVEAEYPWARTPEYAVFRHGYNRKWFGAIVRVSRDKLGLAGEGLVDAINLKCDRDAAGSLRRMPGILSGYHMNKEHWISVLLDGTVPAEQLCPLVDMSHQLTIK